MKFRIYTKTSHIQFRRSSEIVASNFVVKRRKYKKVASDFVASEFFSIYNPNLNPKKRPSIQKVSNLGLFWPGRIRDTVTTMRYMVKWYT